MSYEDREKFRSLDGFVKNTIAERNATDKIIIQKLEDFDLAERRKNSQAFENRRKDAAESFHDLALLKYNEDRSGSVVNVIDGNSLHIRDDISGEEITVGLYGVDSPELQQEHGVEAKSYLASKVIGKSITFKLNSKKYAFRAMVWVDKANVNIMMVKYGHAMKFLDFEDEYSDAFIRAEINAKVARLGIWSYSSPPYPAWKRRLDIIEHRKKEEQRKIESSRSLSTLESSEQTTKRFLKWDEDVNVWRKKWYVKLLAPLGLGSFLKPPKYGD